MDQHYDRAAEDLGNIVSLEHVNTRIPDQTCVDAVPRHRAGVHPRPLSHDQHRQYVDQYRAAANSICRPARRRCCAAASDWWCPISPRWLRRLAKVKPDLEGTQFDFREGNDILVDVISPVGQPHPLPPAAAPLRPGQSWPGLRQFDVPPGSADGIARFYREVIETPARSLTTTKGGGRASRSASRNISLFRETDAAIPAL